MKNKNKKMSNKAKRLNVLKILLLFCFSAVGHRILNKHAYNLLTSAAKQRVDNIVVNGNGSRGKDIMVIDKITNFGNSQPTPNPWPYVVGLLPAEPYICNPSSFKPQVSTDNDDPGGHTKPDTCSLKLSTWCNSANCAYNNSSYTFPLHLSRALHFIQDMCCAVHSVPVSGTGKTFYSASGYTDDQFIIFMKCMIKMLQWIILNLGMD